MDLSLLIRWDWSYWEKVGCQRLSLTSPAKRCVVSTSYASFDIQSPKHPKENLKLSHSSPHLPSNLHTPFIPSSSFLFSPSPPHSSKQNSATDRLHVYSSPSITGRSLSKSARTNKLLFSSPGNSPITWYRSCVLGSFVEGAKRGSILFRPVAHEVGGVADYGCEDILLLL